MKKLIFSALISCGLLAAGQTNGQTFGQNGMPVIVSRAGDPVFYAYPDNHLVVLRWTTNNETGVDHYLIEHSTDSTYFNSLHEVVSNGRNDTVTAYEDADSYPASAINYYRLVTVMQDGDIFHSQVIRVDMDPGQTPVLKPTVLHLGATLRMDNPPEQPLVINFYSSGGTLMKSVLVNGSSFNINTAGWNKGIFFYRISDGTHALINAGKIMVL